jgi:hypothetical protein
MVVSARVGTPGTLPRFKPQPRRADVARVIVERFPVSVGVLAGLVIVVTGAFVLSMPAYRSPIDKTMLKGPQHGPYAVADVRTAFALHGVRFSSRVRALSGVTLVGASSELYVFVADPRSGVDSSLRTGAAYERRIGNVRVHYGGSDRRVLAHVKAAVAALMR